MGVVHAVLTVVNVVGTGNHYWADAVVVLALVGVALAATRPQRARAADDPADDLAIDLPGGLAADGVPPDWVAEVRRGDPDGSPPVRIR